MVYPSHYSTAIARLRRVEALVERELETATGGRRVLLDAIRKRTTDAIRSPYLLADAGFAERVSTQARADLAALEQPG